MLHKRGDATRGNLNNGASLKSRNVETAASVHGFVRDRLKISSTMIDKEEWGITFNRQASSFFSLT